MLHKTQYPVSRIETISSGKIDYNRIGYVEHIDEKYRLKRGDLLLTNINSIKWIGNTVYFEDEKPLYHGMNLMLLRLKTNFNSKFIYYYILYHKNWFEKMACQAVNQASINKSTLEKFKVKIPIKEEQDKIANFLSLVDKKIELLEKKHKNIQEFKKAFIQKLRWDQIKFKNENNENYPNWEEVKLKDVLFEHKLKSTGNEEIYSVSVHKGVINQIEHLGRSFASEDLSRYKLAKSGDIIYTKSPTAGFELGIIKQNKNNVNVLVSPLYGVFTPKTKELGNYLDCYFESQINTRNYLHPIVQKGAKNTMNISNKVFLSRSLLLPSDYEEQQKISNSIDLINFKEENIVEILENLQDFKKGLLQKMFV